MPYITKLAPGQEPLEVLRSLYIKTERKIINEITRKRNLELVDYAEVAALERVQAILRDMISKTDEYVPQVIEKYFYNENTMPGASKGYINAMSLTSTQTNISQILINNLLAQIDEAAGVAFSSASKFLQIGRLEADELRSLTLEAAAEREAAGRGWQTIQNELAAQLNAKGLTSFTDAAGREWSLANYCTMATRTTGRQAQVAAALTADDHDLWQISKIGSTCPVCSVYEGRVYSKSGTNPDYPPLAMAFGKIDPEGSNDLSNTYLNIHPNCLHSLVKYTTIGKTEEQIKKDKRFSSFTERPDTVDYRSKKQVKAYREKEAARAKYRQDLKQYEKYKAALGNDFPKTFETFEKHKKLDDDIYKSWEKGFREMNAKADKIDPLVNTLESEFSKHKGPAYTGGEVSWNYLNKLTLAEKLDVLDESKITKRRLNKGISEIIKHRENTRFEDLAYIDSTTGKLKINKKYDSYNAETGISTCKPSDSMNRMLKKAAPRTIIGVHNHPSNGIVSKGDLLAAKKRLYKYGMAVCHDGTIYKYSVSDNFKYTRDTKIQLAKLREGVYNNNEEAVKSAISSLNKLGVELEVIR